MALSCFYFCWKSHQNGLNVGCLRPLNVPAVLLWCFHTLPSAVGLSLPAFSGSPPPKKDKKREKKKKPTKEDQVKNYQNIQSTLNTKLLDANLSATCNENSTITREKKVKMINTIFFFSFEPQLQLFILYQFSPPLYSHYMPFYSTYYYFHIINNTGAS